MQLVANWRAVLLRAWSVRLIALSLVFGAVELALPFLDGVLPVRPGTFAALVFLTNIGAGISRLVAQRQFAPTDTIDEESGV